VTLWNINGTTIELILTYNNDYRWITGNGSSNIYITYKSPKYYALLEEAKNVKAVSTEGL
jgi:hypothetical protein